MFLRNNEIFLQYCDIVKSHWDFLKYDIQQMLLTLTRWMRQNNEQAEQVKTLFGMLKESDRQRNDLLHELDALKLQVYISLYFMSKF